MNLPFLRRGRLPLSPGIPSFSAFGSNSCTILLVDSVYLTGTYHAASYGSTQPSPTVGQVCCVSDEYVSRSSHKYWRKETHGAAELIHQLLDTYKQVTAVPSGNAAMSYLHCLSSAQLGYTILLIDLDHHTYDHNDDMHPTASSKTRSDSESDTNILYGIELLKVVLKEIDLGIITNVIPIAVSRNDSHQLMATCLDLGAADYLMRPVPTQVIKTLWLNSTKYKKPIHSPDIGGEAVTRTPKLNTLTEDLRNIGERLNRAFSRDGWLEEMIINHYAPPFHRVNITKFPRLDRIASQERMSYLRQQYSDWDFCPYDYSEDDLLRCILIAFEDSLAIKGLRNITTTDEMLHRFILAIRAAYSNPNPYHNFYHAVDVLQATYFTLKNIGLLGFCNSSSIGLHKDSSDKAKRCIHEFISPNDIFALIVSSLAHDLGHPGVNNAYMINAQTPLALLYNDQSVLENYHTTSLFLLIKKHNLNFFGDQSTAEFKDFRKLVVNSILATDMSAHFEYIRSFTEQSSRLESTTKLDSTQEKILFCSAILKCSDISNAARSFHVASRWTDCLMNELKEQASLEERMGYPINMNPEQSDADLAQGQIDFIGKLALPLFQVVGDMIPEMAYCVEKIKSNITTWEHIRDHGFQKHSIMDRSENLISGDSAGATASTDAIYIEPIIPIMAETF